MDLLFIISKDTTNFFIFKLWLLLLIGMASEGKTVGKPHFQHQDKANTQSRIMIANHAARGSKKVGLARELGSMNDSGKEVQNIQGMLNNQMDGVSKHQHNDLQEFQNIQGKLNNQKDKVSKQQHNDVQGMALKNKNVGKTHFQLQDETNTQPLILSDNHTTRNSKKRDCQSIQGVGTRALILILGIKWIITIKDEITLPFSPKLPRLFL
ncbi:uncharacterized protein [Primulina eburnea]|uniref:uncharacterized protein n=1 Tax=Primulina eburnea TaxID=1245227 RepID=UPI003C6C6978